MTTVLGLAAACGADIEESGADNMASDLVDSVAEDGLGEPAGGVGPGAKGPSGGTTGDDGADTGGAADGTGGREAADGTGGAGATVEGGSALADSHPCDGSTAGYDRVVSGAGASWMMNTDPYDSLAGAMTAALAGGGVNPDNKLKVLIRDAGDVPADVQIRVFSNTLLNVCGTLKVIAPTGGSDRSPIYARSASDIAIPHLTVTGVAQYGVFFRSVNNVHFGKVDIRLRGGLGMRFDNNPTGNSWANSASNAARQTNYRLDDVYVDGTSHGVEFYGVDGITISKVVARNTSQAGLMLNNSRNVDVGLIDGQGVSPNAGYAVFRMANDNGKDWDTGTHPLSIHVAQVVARESGGVNGQGIFCLTDSGGVAIDAVDLENTAGNSIWLEWCTTVRIGSASATSRIHDSGNVMISYNDVNDSTRLSNDIVFENIAITQTNVSFNHGCPPSIDWIDVTQGGVTVNTCE